MTVKDFASVTGADIGIWLMPDTGNVTVSNVGTVTGTAVDGILATTIGGTIAIQNTGNVGGITGGIYGIYGIYADAIGGNVNIGTTTTNGVITGGTTGILALSLGAGNVAITTNKDVTGTAVDGIYARAGAGGAGNIAVNVQAGTVKGLVFGADLVNLGTGNVDVTIAAPATSIVVQRQRDRIALDAANDVAVGRV